LSGDKKHRMILVRSGWNGSNFSLSLCKGRSTVRFPFHPPDLSLFSIMSQSASAPSPTPDLTPEELAAKKLKHTQHLQIFITILIDLIGFGIMIPIIQPFVGGIAENAGLTQYRTLLESFIMGVYSLMQFLFSPIFGRISDRVGRRPVILASLIGSLIGYIILASATYDALPPMVALIMIFLARITTGICGASVATAQAYLGDITAPEKRTAVMGMIGAAFGIGFVLGPLIGGVASHYLGLMAPFLIAAALTIYNFIQCYRKLPESLPFEKRGIANHQRTTIRDTLRHYSSPPLAMILLANFLAITAFAMMTTSFVPFTKGQFHFNDDTVGYVFCFIGLIGVVIQGGLIRKVAKHGREKKFALAGIIAMAVALALLPQAAPWLSLLLVMALLSSGNSFATPTLNSLASQCGTVQTQGETMGAMSSAGSLGRCCGPLIAGFTMYSAADGARFQQAFYVAAGIMCLAAVVALTIRRSATAG
jgi:DHA1 family tetracycline resistance protein-like MFS transporter